MTDSTREILDEWPEITVLYPDESPEAVARFDVAATRHTLDRLDFHVNVMKLSEWAEAKRHQPAGSPFEGQWKNWRTPYMIEPMDNLAPSSSVEVTVLMKPVQAGATAGTAENKMGYSVDVDPCNILYVTATDELGKEFGAKRLNALLELCGLRDKLRDPFGSKSSKSTGDKLTSKIFDGGNILICSYNQAALLRMSSFQVVIFDEVDTAPPNVNGEGDPLKIAEARTTAYEGRKKILIISTPITAGISPIHAAYMQGDRRRYHIPCPHCGEYFCPELIDEKYNCALQYEFANEAKTRVDPESVYLPCPHCDGEFKNYHKSRIYRKGLGRWVPTNDDAPSNYRSYMFDALLCPPGMVSFESLAQMYVDAQGDPEAMQAFVNLRGAQPYQEQGEMPTDEQIREKIGGYTRASVPEWMGIVTAGGDLHKDRLDVEIVGFNGNETFSLEWMHIFGKPTYSKGGSLWKFARMFENGKLPGKPRLAFIDVRYEMDEVVSCAANNENIFAVLGEEWLPNRVPFRETTLKKFDNMEAISVNTGLLKWRTMNSLKKHRLDSGEYPYGYVHFPTDYEEDFYSQLTNEVKTAKYDPKTGDLRSYDWVPKRKDHSHALDCHVYALAAEEYEVWRLASLLESEGIPIEEGYRDLVWDILKNPSRISEIADALNK